MTFDEILAQVIELLQRQGRISYGALRRRYNLDAAYLEDLKDEIIKAQRLAIDEDGSVMVWAGDSARAVPEPASQANQTLQPPVAQEEPPTQVEPQPPQRTRRRTTPAHSDVL